MDVIGVDPADVVGVTDQAPAGRSSVVELRQYTLNPGQRETLIRLFDRHFVESQEIDGTRIIGQFRDLDDEDRFVWLRGFVNMSARARSLTAFYDGPVWRSHRDAANATMADSSNVLLLRPARTGSDFAAGARRDPIGATEEPDRGLIIAVVVHLERSAAETGIVPWFEHTIASRVREDGGSILGYFVTEQSENNFPRLPVREGENVFVWFAGSKERTILDLVTTSHGTDLLGYEIGRESRVQVLRLAPTSRSALNGYSRPCDVPARLRAKGDG